MTMPHLFYNQQNHGPFELFALGDTVLAEGGTLRDATLAYATFGTLSPARDNAILVTTWYSGTSKIMEQVLVGPGRVLDPAKYFIIIANQLGGGLSSSPSNTSAPFNGPNFPQLRIEDDVAAQHRLVTENFGITALELVIGGSMGAQQTFEWAARHPEMVKRAMPIAGTARNKPHCKLVAGAFVAAMRSDPKFDDGFYSDSAAVHRGLVRHARAFAVTGLCQAFYKNEIWRTIGFSSVDDFLVGFMDGYFLPMDPNNLIAMASKWQGGDTGRLAGGDLAAALGRVTAKTTVVALSTDIFFPPDDVEDDQKLIAGSRFAVIDTECGHAALFALEPSYVPQLDRLISDLLAGG